MTSDEWMALIFGDGPEDDEDDTEENFESLAATENELDEWARWIEIDRRVDESRGK